jgi:hypothetical protein
MVADPHTVSIYSETQAFDRQPAGLKNLLAGRTMEASAKELKDIYTL